MYTGLQLLVSRNAVWDKKTFTIFLFATETYNRDVSAPVIVLVRSGTMPLYSITIVYKYKQWFLETSAL